MKLLSKGFCQLENFKHGKVIIKLQLMLMLCFGATSGHLNCFQSYAPRLISALREQWFFWCPFAVGHLEFAVGICPFKNKSSRCCKGNAEE